MSNDGCGKDCTCFHCPDSCKRVTWKEGTPGHGYGAKRIVVNPPARREDLLSDADEVVVADSDLDDSSLEGR